MAIENKTDPNSVRRCGQRPELLEVFNLRAFDRVDIGPAQVWASSLELTQRCQYPRQDSSGQCSQPVVDKARVDIPRVHARENSAF